MSKYLTGFCIWTIIMLLAMLSMGCSPHITQYPIEKMSTVRPLVENEYEIAGKEISEHKLE